jgi:hypothetical protein
VPPDLRRILPLQRLAPDPPSAPSSLLSPAVFIVPGSSMIPQVQQQRRGARGAAGVAASSAAAAAAAAAPGASSAAAAAAAAKQQQQRPAALGAEEQRLRALIESEVLDHSPDVSFADVAGLGLAKQALQEAVVLPTCVIFMCYKLCCNSCSAAGEWAAGQAAWVDC